MVFADNEEMCVRLARQLGKDRQYQAAEKEIRAKQARLSEVDGLFQSLYEDRNSGSITERNYKMMCRRYKSDF